MQQHDPTMMGAFGRRWIGQPILCEGRHVRVPRVRDQPGNSGDRIRSTSEILPTYARRSKSLEVRAPVLYLKGISAGAFAGALAALLG
jgi:hypothetical protein